MPTKLQVSIVSKLSSQVQFNKTWFKRTYVFADFTDAAEAWLDSYETKDFKEQIARIWEQLRPFYLQLHAYVRRKLRETYGETTVSKRGPIPAHLLGKLIIFSTLVYIHWPSQLRYTSFLR